MPERPARADAPSGVAPAAPRPADEGRTSPVHIAIAWAVVGIPALWGVWQVFVKSMALFR